MATFWLFPGWGSGGMLIKAVYYLGTSEPYLIPLHIGFSAPGCELTARPLLPRKWWPSPELEKIDAGLASWLSERQGNHSIKAHAHWDSFCDEIWLPLLNCSSTPCLPPSHLVSYTWRMSFPKKVRRLRLVSSRRTWKVGWVAMTHISLPTSQRKRGTSAFGRLVGSCVWYEMTRA